MFRLFSSDPRAPFNLELSRTPPAGEKLCCFFTEPVCPRSGTGRRLVPAQDMYLCVFLQSKGMGDHLQTSE